MYKPFQLWTPIPWCQSHSPKNCLILILSLWFCSKRRKRKSLKAISMLRYLLWPHGDDFSLLPQGGVWYRSSFHITCTLPGFPSFPVFVLWEKVLKSMLLRVIALTYMWHIYTLASSSEHYLLLRFIHPNSIEQC